MFPAVLPARHTSSGETSSLIMAPDCILPKSHLPWELQVRESITESMCIDRLKLQQFLGFETFPQSFSLLLAASCNCLLHHSQKPWHRGPHKTAHKHIKMDHCIWLYMKNLFIFSILTYCSSFGIWSCLKYMLNFGGYRAEQFST